jgi:hypothetical protein
VKDNRSYGGSRDSSVGIATGYGLDDREVGVRFPEGSRILSSPCRRDRLWGPIQWVPGALSLGAKRQGRVADRSLPTSAEVKRHYATSRKVAGSIPDEVIGFFN